MTPKNKRPSGASLSPRIPPAEAIALLNRQKERGMQLASDPWNEVGANAWYNTTREILALAFGPESRNVGAVLHAGPGMRIYSYDTPQSVMDRDSNEKLKAAVQMLDSCIDQLEFLAPKALVAAAETGSAELAPKVFIVHGRDEGRKEAVARFVGDLGLEPVVLHEQPNLGLTLI
jgi:hypothetical protein